LIIDPNNLAAEIARILSASRLPDIQPLPKTEPAGVSAPAEPQDLAELRALLQFDVQTQRAASVSDHVAKSISYSQAQDALLAKIEKTLGRMLELSRLSLQPNMTAEHRAGLAIEFAVLQKEITTVAARQFDGHPLFSTNATDWMLLKYGFPAAAAAGWSQLLEKIKREEGSRKARWRRGAIQFPKISVITILAGDASGAAVVQSVLEQDYPNLEFIIIGSGRLTGAEELLERHRGEILYHPDSVDHNHSQALHDACERSTGDIMTWLDPGDQLLPHSLQTVGSLFLKNREIEWLAGHPGLIREQGIAMPGILPSRSHEDFLEGRVSRSMRKGSFWRRTLWDRAASGRNAGFDDPPDLHLWLSFFRFSSPESVNALLCGEVDDGVLNGLNASSAQTEHAILATERQRLEVAGLAPRHPIPPLQWRVSDLLPFEVRQPLDAIVTELEAEMQAANWNKARILAGTAVAAQPLSPDLQQLHALCEYSAGRVVQAQAILQNLAFRFSGDSTN
jgi:hypothetical protein